MISICRMGITSSAVKDSAVAGLKKALPAYGEFQGIVVSLLFRFIE